MLYVISKSLDPEDPCGLGKDTSIVYLSCIDREGFTFSSVEKAIVFPRSFAFRFEHYINHYYGDQLSSPVMVELYDE